MASKQSCCPHVISAADNAWQDVSDKKQMDNRCDECGVGGPNLWLCLDGRCHYVGCDESVKDHSFHHGEKTNHYLSMNLSNLRIWCSSCECEVFVDANTPPFVMRDRNQPRRYQQQFSPARSHTPQSEATGSNADDSESDDEDMDKKPRGLTGLENIGNTCYLNAAIQSLSNCPPLTQFFLDCQGHVKPEKKPMLSRCYMKLILQLWHKHRPSYVIPSSVVHAIKQVHPMFSGYTQQDSQEFLRCFMDQVHEELKHAITAPSIGSDSEDESGDANPVLSRRASDTDVSRPPTTCQPVGLGGGGGGGGNANGGWEKCEPGVESEYETCDSGLSSERSEQSERSERSSLQSAIGGSADEVDGWDGAVDAGTDGRIDEQTDDQNDVYSDGQTNNQVDYRIHGRTDDEADERTHSRTDDQTNDGMDGRTDGQTDSQSKTLCTGEVPAVDNGEHQSSRSDDADDRTLLMSDNNDDGGGGDDRDGGGIDIQQDAEEEIRVDTIHNETVVMGDNCTDDRQNEISDNVHSDHQQNTSSGNVRDDSCTNAVQQEKEEEEEQDEEMSDRRTHNKDVIDAAVQQCVDSQPDVPSAAAACVKERHAELESEHESEQHDCQHEMGRLRGVENNVQDVKYKRQDTGVRLSDVEVGDLSQHCEVRDSEMKVTTTTTTTVITDEKNMDAGRQCDQEESVASEYSDSACGDGSGVQTIAFTHTIHKAMSTPNISKPAPTGFGGGQSSKSVPHEAMTFNSHNERKKKPQRYRSIISDIFDGKILSSVQCLTCERVSSTKETFQDLSLPIPGKDHLYMLRASQTSSVAPSTPTQTSSAAASSSHKPSCGEVSLRQGWVSWMWCWLQSWFWGPAITLQDCLAAFFSADELKGDNMYSCGKCHKLRNGIKYSKVLDLPEILSIHLKRFRHEFVFSSKINNYVSFPLEGLDMGPYLHNDCSNAVTIYDLVAVICHHGTAGGGHYTSYGLNYINESWYEFDDQYVTEVDPLQVQNCEAYVLFYRKRNLHMIELREEAQALSTCLNDSIMNFYISKQWINRFNTFAEPGPIFSDDFLCRHRGVHPHRWPHIGELVQEVPAKLWAYIHDRFGGGPPVTLLYMCTICKTRMERLKKRQKDEMDGFIKLHEEFQKGENPPGPIYAISISWFKQWETFVRGKVDEPPGPINNSCISVKKCGGQQVALKTNSNYGQLSEDMWRFLVDIYSGGPVVTCDGRSGDTRTGDGRDVADSRTTSTRPSFRTHVMFGLM